LSSAELEQVFRTFFESPREERVELADGTLRDYLALALAAEGGQVTEEERRLDLRRFDVVHDDSRIAVAEVEARLAVSYRHSRRGRSPHRRHVAGRVLFQRADGAWRVADYVSDGVRMSDGIALDVSGTAEAPEVAVRARGAFRDGRSCWVVLDVENTGSAALKLEQAALARRTSTGWSGRAATVLGPERFQPGERTTTEVWVARMPVPNRWLALQLVFESEGAAPAVPLQAVVDLAAGTPGTAPPLPRQPLAHRHRRLARRDARVARALLPLLVVVVVLAALQQWVLLGALLVAGGAVNAFAAVQVRRRGVNIELGRWLAAAAVVVAAGVVLVLVSGTD
jgi:hypothetical protein